MKRLIAIGAILVSSASISACGAQSWAARCMPVITDGPGAYPMKTEVACQNWNARQAVVYNRTHKS
jgi:hypothetical protein